VGDQPNILQWALWLTNQVITTSRIGGEKTAFGQYFDREPENQGGMPEINVVRLNADEGRAKIGEQLKGGFDGMAALTCLQERDGKLWLYVEAYDTRSRRSMSSQTPMKRTMTGKLKQMGNHELLGIPSIPGIFVPASAEGKGGPTDGEGSRNTPHVDQTTRPPTTVETDIGGTRFFDLSAVAETSASNPVGFKCGSCGEAVDADDRFCSSCGQDLIAL
jgi:hypothetical protein